MPNATQVTAGKPAVGGHVWRAPIGTEMPATAVATLNSSFVDMGYISEDGVTNANSPETAVVNAWGGTPVLVTQTSKNDTYKMTFISVMNPEVLKMRYGDTNVTGTAVATGISVTANAKELTDYIYVIDMIAKGNVAHRVVIPCAHPSEFGDIVYNDSEPVGYDTTLNCTADSSGNTHYEYWQTNS